MISWKWSPLRLKLQEFESTRSVKNLVILPRNRLQKPCLYRTGFENKKGQRNRNIETMKLPLNVSLLLGPPHTRAKSRDHEIVGAQRKCPKAVPTHLQNHVVWSRIFKCSVKSYVTRASTKCYFNEFLFMRVLTHGAIEKSTVVSVQGVLLRGGF
jgi:hypothetical protein